MQKYTPEMVSGMNFYHVSSMFQKAIRRGEMHLALWAGTEFYLSNAADYCWTRMQIIVSEDVGIANPTLPAQINALYEHYMVLKRRNNKHQPERLPFVHAIMLLVQSPKSRMVDNLLCEYFDLRSTLGKPQIPDYVYDMHTKEGRKMGRGNDHFYTESAKITNEPDALLEMEYEIRDRVWEKYTDLERQGPSDPQPEVKTSLMPTEKQLNDD